MKSFLSLIILCLVTISLTGCGYNRGDRIASGALIGVGVGAVTTAAIGSGVGAGALIGVGAGALLGGTTTPEEIYLGTPIWEDNGYFD